MSTNHELEQRIKRLETLLGRGVEHLSLEPDGTLMIDSLRYDTPQAAGYITDQYGNFYHSRSATGDSWSLANNANSAMLTFYWETGNLDIKGNLDVKGNLKSNRAVISTSFSGVAVPSRASTTVARLTLNAGTKYVVIGYCGVGAVSGVTSTLTDINGYNNIALGRISGTCNVERSPDQKTPSYSGGGASVVGYYDCSSSVVVGVNVYLYGHSTSNANGWMVAIPL